MDAESVVIIKAVKARIEKSEAYNKLIDAASELWDAFQKEVHDEGAVQYLGEQIDGSIGSLQLTFEEETASRLPFKATISLAPCSPPEDHVAARKLANYLDETVFRDDYDDDFGDEDEMMFDDPESFSDCSPPYSPPPPMKADGETCSESIADGPE